MFGLKCSPTASETEHGVPATHKLPTSLPTEAEMLPSARLGGGVRWALTAASRPDEAGGPSASQQMWAENPR